MKEPCQIATFFCLKTEKRKRMDTENNISRREALKRIGATVISGAVASSGIMAMAACGGRENRRVVLYFTGTGNCLYVARHLGAGG